MADVMSIRNQNVSGILRLHAEYTLPIYVVCL